MNQDSSRTARKLAYMLDEFRRLDPEMPAQRMVTFLTIALREGLSINEMANLTGQSTASSTRNLQALGLDKIIGKRQGKNGVGLVRLETDPLDGRKKNCYITTTGQNLLAKLAHHMEA